MFKNITTAMLFCFVLKLGAQTPKVNIPKWSVKFTPTALVHPFHNAIQFAGEYRLVRDFTLQHELGFIADLNDHHNSGYWGFRLRNELRNYIPNENPEKNDMRFTAVQLMAKRVHYEQELITVSRAGGAFNQNIETNIDILEYGILFGIGKLYHFDKSPFYIEISAYAGLRTGDIKAFLPEDAEVQYISSSNPINRINYDASALFAGQFSIRIGYEFY